MNVREPANERAVRILVIDGDSAVAGLPARVLEKAGYRAVITRDHDTHPGIDLVIADLNTPGDDGMEALRRIRRSNSSVKVIGTAGFTDDVFYPGPCTQCASR